MLVKSVAVPMLVSETPLKVPLAEPAALASVKLKAVSVLPFCGPNRL